MLFKLVSSLLNIWFLIHTFHTPFPWKNHQNSTYNANILLNFLALGCSATPQLVVEEDIGGVGTCTVAGAGQPKDGLKMDGDDAAEGSTVTGYGPITMEPNLNSKGALPSISLGILRGTVLCFLFKLSFTNSISKSDSGIIDSGYKNCSCTVVPLIGQYLVLSHEK